MPLLSTCDAWRYCAFDILNRYVLPHVVDFIEQLVSNNSVCDHFLKVLFQSKLNVFWWCLDWGIVFGIQYVLFHFSSLNSVSRQALCGLWKSNQYQASGLKFSTKRMIVSPHHMMTFIRKYHTCMFIYFQTLVFSSLLTTSVHFFIFVTRPVHLCYS